MKLFNKKEEKNKVGRPRLADIDTKKKAIISICVCLVLVLALLLTGVFKLNVINLNKLKGAANVNLCSEIPAKYQPRSESNPEGLYEEYGFTDPKFYSAVVSTYNSEATYCSTITEEQLRSITRLDVYSTTIDNADGVQYLTGLTYLSLRGTYSNKGSLSSIDVSKNTALIGLDLADNNLSSIAVSKNTALISLDLSDNNLSSIDLSQNKSLTYLILSGNNLSSIDLSQNTALISLSLPNNFTKSYSSTENSILLDETNIITAYPNETTYTIQDPGIATYNNGVVERLRTGITTLKINYKLSKTKTFEVRYAINFIELISSYYTININEKTTDAKGEMLSKLTSRYDVAPLLSGFRAVRNNDKIEIKDSSGNIVDTYTITNYILYNLTSYNGSYVINHDKKTIDVKGEMLGNVYSFSTNSSDYSTNKNNDKIEIKDRNGNIVDTYTIINYTLYKISTNSDSGYTVDNVNKIIDANGNIFGTGSVWVNSSSGSYDLRRNGDKVEIIDEDKNVVDTYTIINERKKDTEAYKKVGFKDKNFYACVVASAAGEDEFDKTPMYKDYLLTDEEMKNMGELYCINQNVTDTTGIEKLTNLYSLLLRSNKLTSLDVSKNINLNVIEVSNNNISKIIGLDKLEGLGYLIAYNNNLSNLDISKTTNLEQLMLSNNPLANTLYMLKGKEIDYKKDLKLNEAYEIKYDITDTNVVSYKDSKLKALKEGITNIYLSTENTIYNYKPELWDKLMACEYLQDEKACEEIENITDEEALLPYLINQEVKVYDILSDVYKIDKEKKEIDASGLDLDTSKIKLTLEGLSASVKEDNFIIKDGETIVDTYKILNMKKVVDKPNNDKKTTANSSNKTTKKSNNKTTTTEDLSDIELKGSFVSMLTLGQIKGKDRNIVVKNDGITITINGKDIEKIEGNLDLSYEINILKESLIYNQVKDKVNNGIVLSFKKDNLPGKALVDVEVTDKIKESIGTKDLYLYNYNLDKMTLIADKININNNKLSFYINKLGNYVLTNNELNKKNVDIDSSMYKENDELSKNISNKKLIIPIVIFIILIVLGIIGYLIYKKNKEKYV